MLQLHTANRSCGRTLTAGIKALSLIDPQDLLKPLPRYTVPRIEAIEFKPGRAAFFVPMEYFTARYQERTNYDEAGTVFEHAVLFDQRGININTDFLRAKLASKRVHALIRLQDDTQRIIQSLLFQSTADSGDASNQNKYAFEGRVQRLRPAASLTGTVNIISPPYVPPTVEPGGGGSGFEATVITTSQPQHTVQVPAGRLLVAIFVQSTAVQAVTIGYTAGSTELAGPNEQEANAKHKYGDNWLIASVNTNIFITGLAGTNTITVCIL